MNFLSYYSLRIISSNFIKNLRRDIITIRITSLINYINYYLKIRCDN